MKLKHISLLLFLPLVTCQDDATETIEDNIIFEQDIGSGDEICDEESGSGENVPEVVTDVLERATYTMTGSSGLNINIALEKMSDDTVRMVCEMEDSGEAGVVEDGSGDGAQFRASSFPSKLYLIREVAVCNDLATAVGNDITTDALELATVSGTGSASETLSVTWTEVSQSNCLAMLKQNPTTTSDEEETGDVVIEYRALPRSQCRRTKSILTVTPSTRIFTSLNLAAYSLVSIGITSAFTVAAVVATSQGSSSSSSSSNTGSSPDFWEQTLYTIAPFAFVLGFYYWTGLIPVARRRNDNFRRKGHVRRRNPYLSRMAEVRDGIGEFMDNLEPLREFGNHYMKGLQEGPLGFFINVGSTLYNVAMRRWDFDRRRDRPRNYYSDYEYS